MGLQARVTLQRDGSRKMHWQEHSNHKVQEQDPEVLLVCTYIGIIWLFCLKFQVTIDVGHWFTPILSVFKPILSPNSSNTNM